MEPRREKTGIRCFRLGLTHNGLYIHRRRLNLQFRIQEEEGDCTICEAKTKSGFLMTRFNDCVPIRHD